MKKRGAKRKNGGHREEDYDCQRKRRRQSQGIPSGKSVLSGRKRKR